MPISSIGKDLYLLPHISGEAIKASAGALEMSCFLGQGKLKPILQLAGKPIPEVQGSKIVTATTKLSIAHFVTGVNPLFNEWGGIDQVITLFSKPQSNTLTFDYDSSNLVPYLQPPLTPEEIVEGVARPDHIINSLAWYHTSKGGMVSPSDISSRITTGKAQHWYRQVVTDGKGNKSWADWLILNSSQVGLVLDDKFMFTAQYPIVIAPVGDTFGWTGSGASTLLMTSGSSNVVASLVAQRTAVTGDTVTKYSAYIHDNNDASGNFACNVYTVVSGNPTTRTDGEFGHAWTATHGTTLTWSASSTFSLALTNGVTYCVAFGSVNKVVGLGYDAGSAPGRINSTDLSFANPYNYTGTDSGRHYSVYATYTAGGAGANTYNVAITEGFKFGDSPSPLRKTFPSLAEGFKLQDLGSPQRITSLSITEGFKSQDLESPIRNTYLSLADDIKLNDTLATLRSTLLSLAEDVKLDDVLLTARTTKLTLNEGLKQDDILSVLRSTFPSLSEDLKLDDLLTLSGVINTYYVSVIEGLLQNDSLSTTKITSPQIIEGVKLSDLLTLLRTTQLAINEAIRLQDSVSILQALVLFVGGSKLASRLINGSQLGAREVGGSVGSDTNVGGSQSQDRDAGGAKLDSRDIGGSKGDLAK
jgi:hypothetical protein